MERVRWIVDEGGVGASITGVDRSDWTGPEPCPDCGSRSLRHFQVRGSRRLVRDGTLVRRSDYWDATRTLYVECLACEAVLYKHPAVDLLFPLDGEGDAVIEGGA